LLLLAPTVATSSTAPHISTTPISKDRLRTHWTR
jgi:hypothetical protein